MFYAFAKSKILATRATATYTQCQQWAATDIGKQERACMLFYPYAICILGDESLWQRATLTRSLYTLASIHAYVCTVAYLHDMCCVEFFIFEMPTLGIHTVIHSCMSFLCFMLMNGIIVYVQESIFFETFSAFIHSFSCMQNCVRKKYAYERERWFIWVQGTRIVWIFFMQKMSNLGNLSK